MKINEKFEGDNPIVFTRQILRIMKLTIVIMTAFLLQVSALTKAQITLNIQSEPMQKVLKNISKQSGYDFVYSTADLKQLNATNINLNNASIETALKACFADLPLQYEIADRTVMIKRKDEPSFIAKLIDRFQSIEVNGRVVDVEGKVLPGATVKVKATGKGVSADVKGNFHLQNVEEGAVLVVSYTGYISKEVKAEKEMGNIVLELSLSKLDEVQVIAYGTTTQRLSTGNVTTIKADVIEKQPVNNPLLALQGRVPGLFIEQGNGFAGTAIKVRIQGQNSIANGNEPLYVIDGVPFTSQPLLGGNSIQGGTGVDIKGVVVSQGGSPLNFINPSDIESIDVLKDADATSIYGSRAANGAILITTKKGSPGEIKVNANVQIGSGKVARRLDLMNTKEYLEMRREAFKNDGLNPGIRDFDLNGTWDNTREIDWQKELIGGAAKYTDAQVSVSGGSSNTAFLVGAGYHKEGNVFAGDFADIKSSVHFNLNSTSSNQKFKIQISGSFLNDNNKLPTADLTRYAMLLAPMAPNLFNPTGGLNWQPNSNGTTTFTSNPMSFLFSKFKANTSNLVGNGILNYELIEGLEVRSSFGYNKIQSSSIDYKTSESIYPEGKAFAINYPTNLGSNSITSWSIEPQLNYKKNAFLGKLEVLLGMTIQQENRDASSIIATGFNSDQVREDIKSATKLTSGFAENSIYKYNAFFGRLNYNWQEKYIVNLTARRDGSSRFGSENHFHNFSAIGAAWIVSEEKWVKNNIDFLSFAKLRGSYGTTGSDQIANYRFLSLYDAIPGLKPYQGATGYQPTNITNPYIQWEETKKMQIGLDLGFIKDRVLVNLNYAINRSSNQLLQLGLPMIAGFGNVAGNFPATVQNSGWELILSTINLRTSGLKWSSSINLTLPKNKLLVVEDFQNSILKGGYAIGEPLNRLKLYQYLGVDPATGGFLFRDQYGNPTSSPAYDDANLTVVTTDPKYYGGLLNSFEYKGFTLDILFQFTKQIAQNYWFGSLITTGDFASGLGNQPKLQVNRWQSPGDIKEVQKYSTLFNGTSIGNANNSDLVWSDASYIRLKNISLAWNIPGRWRSRMHINNCRVYFQGQNLFTITKYMGLDPESKSSLSLPPLRVMTMGLQIGI